MADGFQVTGLKELRRELKIADAAFPKELRSANKKVADLLAEAVRSAYAALGGSAPKVAPTVKALAQQTRAQLKVGGGSGTGAEVAMGNTFGSRRYPQFPPPGQYALFPTVAAKTDEVIDIYADMLDDLTRRAFPN